MKKLSLLIFFLIAGSYLFTTSHVNKACAAAACTNGKNPSTCSTPNTLAECCPGSTCKPGDPLHGFLSFCQINTTTCPNPGQATGCPTGQVCNAAGPLCGGKNCCLLAPAATCPNPGQTTGCPAGQVCTPAGSICGGNNCCTDAPATTCPNPGQATGCPAGQVCTPAGSICGGNNCCKSGSTAIDVGIKDSPCSNANGNCSIIHTALGDINTSVQPFVRWFLGFVLGLSGGILLLILIIAGYRLMTSQGDPEKVKEARESVTAAIVGLLFIIFSFVILQVITVDILHLPGFGK